MKRFLLLAAVLLPWAASASAITVDGTVDGDYGAAISVQAVETHFGNALPPGVLGGSELDAAYAKIEGGRLYLMLTGNHEPNFNKLEVFIDSVAGGENTLSNVPEYDFFNATPANGFPWNSRNLGGMTFDTGFDADYHLFSRWGSGTSGYEVDFVNRSGGASMMVPGSNHISAAAVGLVAASAIPSGDVGTNASGTALTQNLEFAINNNNAAGVDGCDGSGCLLANQAAALAVTTGMEFSIALADIGNPSPGSSIRISAMINNGDHNYLSNQVLGPFTPTAPDPPGQANPGGNGNNVNDPFNGGGFTGTMVGMNFNNFPGTQFFSLVVPEPAFNPGDHNKDGIVDAADYVFWRKTDGGNQAGYNAFFENFGESGAGAGGGGGVPEPGSLLLAAIGAILGLSFRRCQ